MTPPSKADRLRQRMNRPAAIDPDVPSAPVVPASVPAPPPTHDPTPTSEEPSALVEADPAPETAAPSPEPSPPSEAAPTHPAPRRATRRPGTAARKPPVISALEDPDITPGRKDYRSFYVDDAPFARYRAAIYWASRNPEVADEVAENMSADIEEHMLAVATELEQRLNGGEPFRMPPATKRRGRKPRQ